MRNPLSRNTLSIAVGLAVSAQAMAQQPPALDEIVVVGSRASLQSALQKQRNSDKVVGVVDSDALGNFRRHQRGRITASHFRHHGRKRSG
jgi:hypothetical protein